MDPTGDMLMESWQVVEVGTYTRMGRTCNQSVSSLSRPKVGPSRTRTTSVVGTRLEGLPNVVLHYKVEWSWSAAGI